MTSAGALPALATVSTHGCCGIADCHQSLSLATWQVLWRLRASLNVAQFKGVYEDSKDVHVLMEWCKGGELTSHIGRGHYSERTVRGCMSLRV